MQNEQANGFIGNESDVRRFFATHIQLLSAENNYATIIIPLARRKYHESLAQTQLSLSSTIFQCQKSADQFIRALRRYEVPEGVFVDKKDAPIPRKAIVMYVTVNPMDEVKGFLSLQLTMSQRLYDMSRGVRGVPPFNVYSAYKSALHQSPSDRFVKYDVDSKAEEHISSLKNIFLQHSIQLHLVVETCNGYHVLIDNKNGYARNKSGGQSRIALQTFVDANKEWISKENSSALVVVPGTYQEGFLTRIVNDWGC